MATENPRMTPISVSIDAPSITDIEVAVEDSVARAALRFSAGASIALAVGSRGISELPRIVAATAAAVRRRGGRPFVVPAMGSHGGGTADGQAALLASYGVSEAAIGVPVRSSMETVVLDAPGLGHPAYMDRFAWESDGVILINRIKQHTDFSGFPESGLLKMAVIGLGKKDQATAIHSFGIAGLKERILPTAHVVLATGKVIAGIGIVENALDRPMLLEAIPAARIEEREIYLLNEARANAARLPVDELDALVVDEIGKEISGVGMDTNVIGRIRVRGQEEPRTPRIAAIAAMALTEASHGNAIGVGLADAITLRLFESIDREATYSNVVTSSFLDRGKIPVIGRTEAEAWAFALRSAAIPPGRPLRAIRIKNTLRLDRLLVTEAVLREIEDRADISVLGPSRPLLTGDSLAPFSD